MVLEVEMVLNAPEWVSACRFASPYISNIVFCQRFFGLNNLYLANRKSVNQIEESSGDCPGHLASNIEYSIFEYSTEIFKEKNQSNLNTSLSINNSRSSISFTDCDRESLIPITSNIILYQYSGKFLTVLLSSVSNNLILNF